MFKKIIPALFLFPCGASYASYQTFKVTEVGVSAGTQTVFIVVDANIIGTQCGYQNQFKIRLTDGASDSIMSLALASKAEGSSVTVDYDISAPCVASAQAINWIKVSN